MSTRIADDFAEIARRAREIAGDTATDAMWHWCERCRVPVLRSDLVDNLFHAACGQITHPSCPTCDNRGFVNSNTSGPAAFVACHACGNPWGHTTP